MGKMQIMNISGVDCYEDGGTAYIRLDDAVKGLGITQIKNGIPYIRWDRVEQYLKEIGFPHKWGKGDFIPENIFYRLAMKAKNAVAEAFQAKIADEVIPSIRKHGMYATPATIDNILNDPDFGIRLLEELKKERQEKAVLAAKNGELEAKIEEDRPMTEFGLAISTSEGCVSVAQLAAMLCQKGVDTGEHRLFAEMREDGFLNSSGMYYNKPAQRYLENKMMEYKVFKNKFNNKVTFQPLITPKGIQYFMDYYLRKHGKLTLLTVHRRTVIEKRPNYRQKNLDMLSTDAT